MRKTFRLDNKQIDEFKSLFEKKNQEPDMALDFWKRVARSLNLDYRTIIYDVENAYSFSALPRGHNKHWCYPYPLKCSVDPATVEY